MPYLKNLSSVEVFDDCKPWEFTRLDLVPEECFGDKAARDAWVNNPKTIFHCYSLFEGVQGNLRLHSGANNDEASNPPLLMHGLAVDYDYPTDLDSVKAAMRLMGEILPNWFEQTLSGNGRLLWIFEEPLRFPSRKFALAFLKEVGNFIAIDRLPGLDRPCLMAPERYFTNGGRWTKLSSVLVPANVLRGFFMRVSQRFDWTAKELGKACVSMERMAEELKKKFPRFTEWPGDFVVGSQGPAFWVAGSLSPKSAIVHETGIYTFSGHASKPFFPWAELVGAEFVEKSEDEHLGKAVKDIYYDGKTYFMPGPSGNIVANESAVMRRHLVVMRGVSDKKPKDGGQSMVERALAFIDHNQRVDGAASCAFYPFGIVSHNNKKILNLHRIEAMRPAPVGTCWGPTGKFPFLSRFFGGDDSTPGFFTPQDKIQQLDFFMAWFQYFYRSCLDRSPRSGHGVILAGPVNTGKTFLKSGIVGALVGGCSDASAYLSQQDGFNSELFDYALWFVDDGSMATNSALHRLFSEGVKRTVANRNHRVNEKFRKAVDTPWQGRIFIGLNSDAISIGGVPNLDGNILDKLMLFKAALRHFKFLSAPEMDAMLERELPHFARWLLDWTPPAYVLDGADHRFGITAYCEPTLHRTSNLSSSVSSYSELLGKWLGEFFKEEGRGKAEWCGTATDLRLAMLAHPVYAEALRGYKPETLARTLLQLDEKKMFDMSVSETDRGRIFHLKCEDRFLRAQSPGVPQAVNSRFEKK
jgi:hypothetical protein